MNPHVELSEIAAGAHRRRVQVVLMLYALVAAPALLFAWRAFAPCHQCSQGEGPGPALMLVASIPLALIAAILGWIAKVVFSRHPSTAPIALGAGMLASGVPIAYLVLLAKEFL